MIELKVNYSKISEHLNSFTVDKKFLESSEEKTKVNQNQSNRLTSTESTNQPREVLKTSSKKTTLPQNKSNFKARLSTFTFGSWTVAGISPLLCASYGWKLTDKDILECSTCKAVLCSSLPLPNQLEAYTTFSGILKERLRTAHREWCGWPSNPSPSEFRHPPLEISTHYLKTLSDSVVQLSTIDGDLPYFDPDYVLKKLELEEQTVSLFFSGETNLSKTQIIAELLALCGWVFDSANKLRCEICLRNVGLWNFLQLKNEAQYIELNDKYEGRRAKKAKKEAKQKEKEKKMKLEEENELAKLESEKEALEEAIREEENAQEVERAMEKVKQFEDGDFEKSFNEEGIPEMSEEEESILLGEAEEEEKSNDGNDRATSAGNSSKSHSPEAEGGERSNESEGESSDKDEESSSGRKSDEGPESPESSSTTSEGNGNVEEPSAAEQLKEGASSTGLIDQEPCSFMEEDEEEGSEEDPKEEDNDDLWLEAVGGFVEKNDTKFESSSDTSQGSLELYSPTMERTNRKRSRDSDDSLSSLGEEEEECGAKPSKQPKLHEEVQSEHLESNTSYEQILKEIEEKSLEEEEPLESSKSCSEEEPSDSEDEDDEDKDEDILFEKMHSSMFDPLGQHRHWCGWVIDYSTLYFEEERKHIPGFQILPSQLQHALPELPASGLISSKKYVKNIEGLKAIRNILDSWALPYALEDEEMDDQ